MKKKIILIIIIVALVLSINIVLARIGTTGVELYSKNNYTGIIKYDGKEIELEHVVYKYNGVEYPAYAKNYETQGVTTTNSYTVDVVDQVYDMNLWKIVTNGYPYKTYIELGCNNPEEAYLGTKLAIYNYFYKYEANKFETSNELGQKVINVMQNIINSAQNSTTTKAEPYVDVVSGTNYGWEVDDMLNCMYKTYKVKAENNIDVKTKLVLQGDVPEGVVISNLNNEVKEEFEYGEDIKLSVPRINLIKNGNFSIEFILDCKTFPIYYAIPNTQNNSGYILTDAGIEQITLLKEEEYSKQTGKINIDVKAARIEKPLTNIEFELLNQDEEYIKTYKTDENGEIVIYALPGNYYLRQTKVDEEYSMVDRNIPLKINLHSEIGIHFMLNKKEEINIETVDKNIIVSEMDEIIDLKNQAVYIHVDDTLGCPLCNEENKEEGNTIESDNIINEGETEQNTDCTIPNHEQKEEHNTDHTILNDGQKEEQKIEQNVDHTILNNEQEVQSNVNTQVSDNTQNQNKTEQDTNVSSSTNNIQNEEEKTTTNVVKKLPRTGM